MALQQHYQLALPSDYVATLRRHNPSPAVAAHIDEMKRRLADALIANRADLATILNTER